jgi:hypothetical protein
VAEILFTPDTLEVHYSRNVHHVPLEKIKDMIDIFKMNPLPSGLATNGLNFFVNPDDKPGSENHIKICEAIFNKMEGK